MVVDGPVAISSSVDSGYPLIPQTVWPADSVELPRNRLLPALLTQQFSILVDLAREVVVEVLQVAMKVEDGLEEELPVADQRGWLMARI
jgi:hypothetical protein